MTSPYHHVVSIVVLLWLLRDCSANNPDPCPNPENPLATVPFREVAVGNTYLYASYRQNIWLYDTTNCYLIVGYFYSVYQSEANASILFTLNFGGPLRYLCSNQSNTDIGFIEIRDTMPTTKSLINPSPNFSHITVAIVNVQGNITTETDTSPISATFGETIFSANITFPSYQYQTDELETSDTTPCTEPTTCFKALCTHKVPHLFNRDQAKKYYQQCTCYESTTDTQLNSAEQKRATPLTPQWQSH